MEPTRWTRFQYGAQACRLSFPSFYVPSGTLVRDFKLVPLSYLFGACVIPPGGLLMVGKGLVSSVFRLPLPFFPPSFDCDFLFPPSFVPSFLLLPSPGPDSCYDGLVKISSGDVDLVLLSKSRCNGSGHLLQVRTGQKACSRSFLRWCDFFFLFAFVTTRGRTGMTGRQSVPGLEGPATSDPLLGSWLVPPSPFSS